MKDLPLTWRQFLRILLDGIIPPAEQGAGAAASVLEILFASDKSDDKAWVELFKALRQVPDYYIQGIKTLRTLVHDDSLLDDDLSQLSPEKRLFFLVEYERGEIIMENGAFSDYAALHVQGVVRVWLDAPSRLGVPGKSCWSAPHAAGAFAPRSRAAQAINWLFASRRQSKPLPTAPHEQDPALLRAGTSLPGFPLNIWPENQPSQQRSFPERLMGVTSVVWKQTRTATLLADNDEENRPCRMLVIKRRLLLECLLFADGDMKEPSSLYKAKMSDFFEQSLPQLLMQNRLFRSLFYVEEFEQTKHWESLFRALEKPRSSPALKRICAKDSIAPERWRWLCTLKASRLDDSTMYRVVSELNDILKRADLHDERCWPLNTLRPEEQAILAKAPKDRSLVETIRLNRLLLETALPGIFRSVRNFQPRTRDDFVKFVSRIREHSPASMPLRPRRGQIIFKEGEVADGLYLILEGRVQLSLNRPGGSVSLSVPLFFVNDVHNWQDLLRAFAPYLAVEQAWLVNGKPRARDPKKPNEPPIEEQRLKLLQELAQPPGQPVSQGLCQLCKNFSTETWELLKGSAEPLDDAARFRWIRALNFDVLKQKFLYDPEIWPKDYLSQEEKSLVEKGAEKLAEAQYYRLNRLLIEAALPGVFRSVRDYHPGAANDLDKIWIEQNEQATFWEPAPVHLMYERPKEQIVFNHLVDNGFFGESCIDRESPLQHYQALALTNCNLLRIERTAVLEAAKDFPEFGNKLSWENARMQRRAQQVRLGRRLPPAGLPPEMAAKLVRATNLLLIDMDRCTRCDQCVHACTEAHQGHPRFHRANPEYRFGQWELAGACVHCSDAPCLEACPVGAITLLANGSVQVLRDRCISCRKCEPACPFGVIEYHPPVNPGDGASAKETDYVVSHKCDLCLTKDRDPPCVVACPYGAAKRGEPSQFFPGLKSMARFTDPE
jgi:Fe-S-cluster-containing hydrogenase component 2/CRP-like cAMP-binding protein